MWETQVRPLGWEDPLEKEGQKAKPLGPCISKLLVTSPPVGDRTLGKQLKPAEENTSVNECGHGESHVVYMRFREC